MGFLAGLPASSFDLTITQLYALENYGIDVGYLYPDEVLALKRLEEFQIDNDLLFKHWKGHQQNIAVTGIKNKRVNEIKERKYRNLKRA